MLVSNFQQLTILVNLATSLFLYMSIFSEYIKPWPRLARLGYALLAGSLLIESALALIYTPPPYKEEFRFIESLALLVVGLSLSAFTLWTRHCWFKTHPRSMVD